MTTQTETAPANPVPMSAAEAESRASHAKSAAAHARFYAEVAKQSAPKPAPAQTQPNAEAAEAAKAMQAAKNPDGSRKHTAAEIHTAWTKAYETPVSAGTIGSRDPRVSPSTGLVAKDGFHYAKHTGLSGQTYYAEVPDGHRPDVYDTPQGKRLRYVPDDSAYRGPEIKTTEPQDAFSRQSAERIAALGPERAAQEAQLNEIANTRINGERLYDKPTERARIEEMRVKLYAGEDLSAWLASAKNVVAEANFTPLVKAHGYTIKAPEGIELDSAMISAYAETARAAGLSEAQFQQLVDRHIAENRDE